MGTKVGRVMGNELSYAPRTWMPGEATVVLPARGAGTRLFVIHRSTGISSSSTCHSLLDIWNIDMSYMSSVLRSMFVPP